MTERRSPPLSHRTAIALAVTVLSILGFRSSVLDWNDVPTGSMQPTIAEGDRILVDKLAYDLRLPFVGLSLVRRHDPDRGDIIVFLSPADGTRLVKRVVGLPGDRIGLTGNRLEVNGHVIRYGPLTNDAIGSLSCATEGKVLAAEHLSEVRHAVMVSRSTIDRETFGPVVVPPDHVFVLGDNRDLSLDSREFGFVPRRTVIGRAVGVVASVDPDHRFAPRWHRFMVALK